MTRRAPKSVPAEVAERIAEWVPLSVRDEDPAVLGAVLPVARRLATATGPQKIGAAQSLLWALAPFGVWAYHEHGSFSVRSVSHRNTQLWVTKVNKKQEVGWRSGARAALQRVGRATNESGWPLQPTPVPRQPAVAPYSDEEQDAFLEVAGLPGALNPAGRAWVVAAVFGAGLTGPEIGGTSVADIRNAGNGRLAVQVHGDSARVVPIRECCTDGVREAMRLVAERPPGSSRLFLPNEDRNTAARTASNLPTGDKGGLALCRARNTWLTAHLLAGTSLLVLKEIAGPLSAARLNDLIAAAAPTVTLQQAITEGLKA